MRLNIYIDESGNTGDIHVATEADFDFSGQLCFVLAGGGIGDDDRSEIELFVQELKRKYHIQSSELKSSKLYNTKPNLVAELFDYLWLKEYPVFVEINDKKYFLCMQINNLICRSLLEMPPTDITLNVIQRAADYLYDVLPTRVFALYSKACREREQQSFDDFVSSLRTVLLLRTDEFGQVLLKVLEETLDEYAGEEWETIESLLPEPDLSTKGQTLSALPNIPALANIMTRVEQYRKDIGITETTFVHDEQAYFFHILQDNMRALEENDFSAFNRSNRLNGLVHFHLDKLSLVEGKSIDEIGIQVADVVAGTMYRLWSEFIRNHRFPSKYQSSPGIRGLLRNYAVNRQAFGVNFVVSQRQFDGCLKVISKWNHRY
ncbi:DUF3800 domain-containing protein [Alicyclobacillus mengziensis]|uniref:DUF3800 domain-containing protein n=1 Tax=Alicyclobacillus mengziensis TaxID=2931921 RepID=A0A9X7W1H6_9BACL|nr:DUF3800 domain-containing protein [Alicyclobacillus mengziensis]QSO48480.1 DUF3800 domain-containing protein [Alicyclobacillus mengziensis]